MCRRARCEQCQKLTSTGCDNTSTPVETNRSSFLLLRVGEKRQGVIGLFQPGVPGEQSAGLSVRLMGIGQNAIAHPVGRELERGRG